MKVKQLLDLFATYPPYDTIRFYCPNDQGFYYIKKYSLEIGVLRLTKNGSDAHPISYMTFLDYYLRLPEIHNIEFKIYVHEQEFKIQ